MMNNDRNNSISNAKSSSTKLINSANTDTNMINNSESVGANMPSLSRSSSTDSSLSLDEAVMLDQKKVEIERLEQMAKRRRAVLNGKYIKKLKRLVYC